MEASIVADIKKEFIRSPNSKKATTATDKKGKVDAHESQEKKHSRTKTADSTKKSGEQKSSTKGESGGHHSPQALVPKRTEALPEITQYVDSLIGLEYDVKKYTCFYCNPCHGFITTTAQWEEHLSTPKHRRNVCRWRQCLDLAGECDSSGDKAESAVKQRDVDKYNDNVIIGAGHVVEVCDVNGEPRSWICILCNAVCNSVELLLGHLTSFLHIDNHMERVEPAMYRPPSKEDSVFDNVRLTSAKIEHQVMEQAKSHMEKKGRGKMRRYAGDKFGDWPEEQSENEELMEETVVMDKMEQLFAEDALPGDFPLKYKIIPTSRSVANTEYAQMTVDSSNTMIGMQYMMEIWAPSRRVIPVYYCTLCDYLVTNWTMHCTILKHCAAYLKKNYMSVYECVLLESGSEEEFRRALTMAREKVLLLEGRQAKICHVVQLLGHCSDIFVAVNARIAKRIVEKEKLLIPSPPRAKKRPSVAIEPTQESAKQAKVEPPKPESSSQEKDKKPAPVIQENKKEKADKDKGKTDSKKPDVKKADSKKSDTKKPSASLSKSQADKESSLNYLIPLARSAESWRQMDIKDKNKQRTAKKTDRSLLNLKAEEKRRSSDRKRSLGRDMNTSGHEIRSPSSAYHSGSDPKRRKPDPWTRSGSAGKKSPRELDRKAAAHREADRRKSDLSPPKNKPPPLIGPGSPLLLFPFTTRHERQEISVFDQAGDLRRSRDDSHVTTGRYGDKGRSRVDVDFRRPVGSDRSPGFFQPGIVENPSSEDTQSFRSLSKEDLRNLEAHLRVIDPDVMSSRSCLCHSDVEMLRYRMGSEVIDRLIETMRGQQVMQGLVQ